jgi:hypothetical protein
LLLFSKKKEKEKEKEERRGKGVALCSMNAYEDYSC